MADVAFEAPPAAASAQSRTERQRRLADRLGGLRRRAGLRLDDRSLLTAGSVLVPLGIVLVLLGWYGAAHTTRLFEEIPYLISGGLLGLALTVVGCFCYFGYWLTRILGTARELADSLARIEDRLAHLPAPVAATNGTAPAVAPAGADTYVATRTGTMFHRADCPTVAGRAAGELHVVVAGADGLNACRICLPPQI